MADESSKPQAAASGGSSSVEDTQKTFAELGLVESLCTACSELGWKAPTPIQAEAIPLALEGKDVIGLAETGSGKTAAFSLPILQALLENPQRLFACVLAPTRELAFQISETLDALGSGIGLRTAVIVGGVEMMSQAVALARKPHVVIATPGRLVDHLENTKGFSLRSIKYLVMDEADRMLSMDFEEALNKILQFCPSNRNTYLFSATMTSKVAKLQRASLQDPVKVQVSSKYQTVQALVQQYLFIPAKYKDTYLTYVLNEFSGHTGIVFVATCAAAQRITLMLKNLGFSATALHGQMSQNKRLAALSKFKGGSRNLLVATDVASRGLDIPSVDLVVNFDVPTNGKDYVHRVGRTARAGRAGRAITIITQYDIENYTRIEQLIGKKLPEFPADESTVLLLLERVTEAQRIAAIEMRELSDAKNAKRGTKRGRGGPVGNDVEDAAAAVIQESENARARLQSAIKKTKKAKKGAGRR